jgi:hypothetical protein
MNAINSESITPEIYRFSGTENRGYARSQSDYHLPTVEEKEKINTRPLPRTTSAAASTFPIIEELPIEIINTTTAVNNHSFISPAATLPLSTSSMINSSHSHRRSTGTGPPLERQLSILDPMSDRVSTILVWQNLTVSTREDKKKEFLQHIKLSKNFVSKRKDLLHNISGAITGGLWAVIGKFNVFK